MNNLELMDSLINFRKQDNTFQRSIDERSPNMNFNFFDGPPFASGTPHYGHLLAGAIKDIIPRYMTMRGYQVKRKRGRDCHGLPVEKAVEKDLGIDGKRDIETKIWIESFVEKCRAYVNDTNDVRQRFIDHTARRADIENAYYTMDLDFMESVIYCFSKIYNDNLVYRGFKVQRYCPSCATPLANNEVSDGYEDKTDSAITIKFQLNPAATQKEMLEEFEHTEDNCIKYARAIIKNDKGEILQIFNTKNHRFEAPGGKIDKGETIKQGLQRELKEELGIKTENILSLWAFKEIVGQICRESHLFEVTISGTPTLQENTKHTQLIRAEVEPSENAFWFQLVIEGNIIDNEEELMWQFRNIYTYMQQIPQKISSSLRGTNGESNEANQNNNGLLRSARNDLNNSIYVLARTTTPRTLPSNMFLAAGAEIQYSMVYDFASKEYYILATNLLKKYYKNPEDYLTIRTLKGRELQGLHYEPLFDYITNSNITSTYKNQFFQILNADFVSIEDGTGIVHIAPTFGIEDFDAVSQILPANKALDRLFIAVNEYGEFDKQVPDYQGQMVFDTNKPIIERLKEERKLIKSESITHSYPHCWRCHSPLINKAMSSRFIKEQKMNAQTREAAEQIKFVPESVSNRFVNGLKQAPDWNIARNRYRGSPLPIWQNIDDENDTFALGTLEEIYQLSKTGSKNIIKHILIRHGETDYNQQHKHDTLGKAKLSELGNHHAQQVKEQLKKLNIDTEKDLIIVISPLERTRETIYPFLELLYTKPELETSYTKYQNVQALYQQHYHENTLIANTQDHTAKNHFEIGKNLFVDFRITDLIIPSLQDKEMPHPFTKLNQTFEEPYYEDGESINQVVQREKNYLNEISEKHPTKTIITVSHGWPIKAQKKRFSGFCYKDGGKHVPENGEIHIRYWDDDRDMEVDLHKPYVDNYRGVKDGKTYKRIPEVMDCRFESGAMPFGQEHYVGDTFVNKEFWTPQSFTADFIAEGLDQTRGRFRSLHILGHAITGENAAKNIIVNGLILAEDGKKMSKSLKNYPDPKGLIEKRGGDSFRLYCLSSPVVRAEPMRFNEKGVEQAFRDFTLPLQNVFNFFETYAKVDNWKSDGTEIFYMRHAEANRTWEKNNFSEPLNENGKTSLQQKTFIEKILRINPDIILDNEFLRVQETAKAAQNIMKEYANKEIEILSRDWKSTDSIEKYVELIKQYPAKNILIIGNRRKFNELRKQLSQDEKEVPLDNLEVIELPTYTLTNDLDKWILAELNKTVLETDSYLSKYALDEATKAATDFMDKLTNRYLRRSRRRFWANGMTADKHAAYATLYHVFKRYLQLLAPFAPFITEYLRLQLTPFDKGGSTEGAGDFVDTSEHKTSPTPPSQGGKQQSIHLSTRPIANEKYINKTLIDEIATIRKIIKLALFVRAKNKIAVKQPLQKLEIKID